MAIPTDILGMFIRENYKGFTKDIKKTQAIYRTLSEEPKSYWSLIMNKINQDQKVWSLSKKLGKCNVCGEPLEVICRCEVNKFRNEEY